MRIALIDTIDKTAGISGPNVALASLTGCLVSEGHNVGVLDLFFSSAQEQYEFLGQAWDVIGITATSFAYNVAVNAAHAIRTINHSVPIVLGGAHVSIAREEVLHDGLFDFAIFGEGEESFSELLRLIADNSSKDVKKLGEVHGLIFRSGDQIVVNPPVKRIADLDALPMPRYELFPMDRYSMHTLSTSRGCPYECVYCASSAILGRKWMARSPESLVREIEHLIAGWGNKTIAIVDDSFNLDTQRVKKFCHILKEKKLGIRWSMCGGIRADKIDLEMLTLMKETGCHEIGVGVESANPLVLKNMGKGETIEQIRDAIRLVKSVNMLINASFIIGNPGDTIATIKESIDFARKEKLDSVSFFIAIPYPQTELWDYVEKKGRFLRKDYINYHDFSDEPAFDTPEFTYEERVEAYAMAKQFVDEVNGKKSMNKVRALFTPLLYSIKTKGVFCAIKMHLSLARNRANNKNQNEPNTFNGFSRIETRFSRQG